MNFLRLANVLCLAIFVVPVNAAQKWVDENGYIHFGTKKPEKTLQTPVEKTATRAPNKLKASMPTATPKAKAKPVIASRDNKKAASSGKANNKAKKTRKSARKSVQKERARKLVRKTVRKNSLKKKTQTAAAKRKKSTSRPQAGKSTHKANTKIRQQASDRAAARKTDRNRPSRGERNKDLCIVYTGLIERYSHKLELGCQGIVCDNYLELLNKYRRKKEVNC